MRSTAPKSTYPRLIPAKQQQQKGGNGAFIAGSNKISDDVIVEAVARDLHAKDPIITSHAQLCSTKFTEYSLPQVIATAIVLEIPSALECMTLSTYNRVVERLSELRQESWTKQLGERRPNSCPAPAELDRLWSDDNQEGSHEQRKPESDDGHSQTRTTHSAVTEKRERFERAMVRNRAAEKKLLDRSVDRATQPNLATYHTHASDPHLPQFRCRTSDRTGLGYKVYTTTESFSPSPNVSVRVVTTYRVPIDGAPEFTTNSRTHPPHHTPRPSNESFTDTANNSDNYPRNTGGGDSVGTRFAKIPDPTSASRASPLWRDQKKPTTAQTKRQRVDDMTADELPSPPRVAQPPLAFDLPPPSPPLKFDFSFDDDDSSSDDENIEEKSKEREAKEAKGEKVTFAPSEIPRTPLANLGKGVTSRPAPTPAGYPKYGETKPNDNYGYNNYAAEYTANKYNDNPYHAPRWQFGRTHSPGCYSNGSTANVFDFK